MVPGSQRAGEIRIRRQEITGRAGAFVRQPEKLFENSEVMLGIVNGYSRIGRCWPTNPSRRHGFGPPREFCKVRQSSLGSAHGLQRVERWDPRSSVTEIKTGIRQIQLSFGSASSQREGKSFARKAIFVGGQPGVESLARRVEQDWLFNDPVREQLLGQPGNEDRLKAETPAPPPPDPRKPARSAGRGAEPRPRGADRKEPTEPPPA